MIDLATGIKETTAFGSLILLVSIGPSAFVMGWRFLRQYVRGDA